jgi:ribosomal protein S18 acetylase RimI-like enzyme
MAFKRAPAEHNIVITQAKPADARIASRLIYRAMGRVADFLFGFGSSSLAIRILERLFARNGNRFSYQYTRVAKTLNGDIAGLVLSYPCSETISLYVTMARQLLPLYGVLGSFLFLWHTLLYVLSVFSPGQSMTCRSDEYYISTLAVLPEFEGRGIGTMLLAHAEDRAKRDGFSKCSLGVDIENERAIRLYKRLGYKQVATIRVKCLSNRIGSKGFYRMVKSLRD